VAPVVAAVSFVMAASGAVVGRHAGPLLGRRAEVAGGVALIAIGTVILIEHLTAQNISNSGRSDSLLRGERSTANR